MEIVPHTKIYLLENVRLDNTYENTIFWEQGQEAAQQAYFMSKCPNLSTHSFTDANYQRVNRGVLRISGIPEIIMRCNYMMFQNRIELKDYPTEGSDTNQSFDWVYAFITNVNYVSTFCAEITYEIDVMQTFHFKYALGSCYVEREHTPTDAVGEHIIDEGLPIGDYEYQEVLEEDDQGNLVPVFDDTDMRIVVACSFDSNYQDAVGGDYSGFFSGLVYHTFRNDSVGRASCAQFLYGAFMPSQTGTKLDEIVAVFLAPSWAMANVATPSPVPPYLVHNIPESQSRGSFGGYTAKNNKMYTYPYNYLYVYTPTNCAEYKFEKFTHQHTTQGYYSFNEMFDFSCSPALGLIPAEYEGIVLNTKDMLTCGPFPQLSWITDSYKAWIAQNQPQIAGQLANTFLGNVLGITQSVIGYRTSMANAGTNYNAVYAHSKAGSRRRDMAEAAYDTSALSASTSLGSDIIGGIVNMIQGCINALCTIETARRLPDQVHGNTNSSQLLAILGELRYHAYRRYIRRDYAESVDNYFTMYGYKVNKIETPNRKARKIFTFIKTVNCLVVADRIPTAYESAILTIYNNGIRFWRNGDQIGNYDGDNSPINT
jgi:hypothetical protein